jgi:hydrogenase expression/formation protein HypC
MCLGTPGRIVEVVDRTDGRALVDVTGRGPVETSLAMIQSSGTQPQVGDWVIVHVGLAMAVIDEREARAIIADLQRLEDLYRDLESQVDEVAASGPEAP